MLSTTCKFCGLDRKYKNLAYTSTLDAVCVSPVKCNGLHPNSLDSIRKRGTVEEFYTYEQAMELAYERTEQAYRNSASNHSRRLRNINTETILQRAISFRVANEMQAEYIAYTMGKLSINKLSQAIQYFINVCMDKDLAFLAEYSGMKSQQHVFVKPVPTQTIPKPMPTQTQTPAYEPEDEEVFEI
jgi:hypothetical protein